MAEDDGTFGVEYSENDIAYMERGLAELTLGMERPAHAGATDGFLIDPERAESAIAEMTRIVDDVRRAAMWTVNNMTFRPLGSDEVSVNFANNASTMASRAQVFVRTWADQIEATRDGLQAQLDAYRATDVDNASRLT